MPSPSRRSGRPQVPKKYHPVDGCQPSESRQQRAGNDSTPRQPASASRGRDHDTRPPVPMHTNSTSGPSHSRSIAAGLSIRTSPRSSASMQPMYSPIGITAATQAQQSSASTDQRHRQHQKLLERVAELEAEVKTLQRNTFRSNANARTGSRQYTRTRDYDDGAESKIKCDSLQNCCCEYMLTGKGSSELEGMLERCFGAEESGLNGKLNYVKKWLRMHEIAIPDNFERRCRSIANVRNAFTHEYGATMDGPSRLRFKQDVDITRGQINELVHEVHAVQKKRCLSSPTGDTPKAKKYKSAHRCTQFDEEGHRCDNDNLGMTHNSCYLHGGRPVCSQVLCKSAATMYRRCVQHGGYKKCPHKDGCDGRALSGGVEGMCSHHGGGTRCRQSGCQQFPQAGKNKYCVSCYNKLPGNKKNKK